MRAGGILGRRDGSICLWSEAAARSQHSEIGRFVQCLHNSPVRFTLPSTTVQSLRESIDSLWFLWDDDGNGSIDAAEFKNALKGMGHTDISDDEVTTMLNRVDKNTDGVIDWIEFLR